MRKNRTNHATLSPGGVVKELRLKKGWTQSTLSQITGMAISNLSNIEHGRSRLGEDRAILIAEALGVKPEFLLFPNGFERADLKPRLEAMRKRLRKLVGNVAA